MVKAQAGGRSAFEELIRRTSGLVYARLYLETGVLAQELIILVESYGLSTLVTPAQQDRPFLGLHGFTADRHAPMYTLTMGFNRGAAGIALNAPDEPIAADAP